MCVDLIKCLKIFLSEDYIDLLNFYSMVVDRRTRRHLLKIVLPRCNLKLMKGFFHVRVIQRWNALPEYVVVGCDQVPDINEAKTLCILKWVNSYLMNPNMMQFN